MRPTADRVRPDAGFTIVEVVVAISLFAMVIVGLTASSNSGLRLIGTSKARQNGTQLANSVVETARSTPYTVLGMAADEVYESVPTSPDADVTPGSPPTYDAGAGAEDLVVLAESDQATHHTQEALGGVDFEIYRYVTWVAEAADLEAYKRVTVVVQWTGQDPSGDPNRITLSTFVNEDGVAWETGGTTTSTTTASTSSTSSSTSTTSTTASAGCDPGDVVGPTGSISTLAGTGANQGYTAVPTVALSLAATDPCAPISMEFSTNGTSYSGLEAFATSKAWSVTAGDGDKQIWVRYVDGRNNASVGVATIRLDATRPSTPGAFALAAQGSRSVRLTWTASTDNDSLVGYRVYRQIGSGPFQNRPPSVAAPCSSSPCSWDDSVDSNVTYSYYVVAYDAAGNESLLTATRTRAG